MNDEFTFTLNHPITEEQWDMIEDVDLDNTNEIMFYTKHGKEVKFVKASEQPEIIRCKDCKYQDENWRRVSVRWLPCMEVRTGSNWYCGSAERRTDERI